MKMVKLYSPGPRFNAAQFVEVCHGAMIAAAVVEGGVVVDRDAINNVPAGSLPVWVWLLKLNVNSSLCTGKASEEVF